MPWSASRTTSAGSLISFFIVPRFPRGRRRAHGALPPSVSRSKIAFADERADHAADDRTDDRDPRVAPVRAPLAGDRQDRVHDARTEVARRVDRVAGRAAERHADAEHQQRHGQSTGPRAPASASPIVEPDREDAEDQHERADDLGDEVRGRVADRRSRGEHRELQARVLRLAPVRQVGELHEGRADERRRRTGRRSAVGTSSHSDASIAARPIVTAGFRCATPPVDREAPSTPTNTRHRPGPGDDDPSRVLRLRLVEQHAGHDAVAEQDEQRRADHFSEEHLSDHPLRTGPHAGAVSVASQLRS